MADTFDAMTTSRPYRPALDVSIAAEEIRRGRGTQFCPGVVDAFETLSARGAFTLEAGHVLMGTLFGGLDQR